jgi:prevent-host-death family protein
MRRQIDITELQRRGAALLEDLADGGEPYIVEHDGQPAAVLMSYVEYLRLQPAPGEEVHERFHRLLDKMDRLNSGFSEEEVARDVAEAIDEVRRGR